MNPSGLPSRPLSERSSARDEANRRRVYILLPCHNDWPSLSLLLPALDRAIGATGRTAVVRIMDDASTEPSTVLAAALRTRPPQHLERVEVVRLVRNVGHQRAIAVGLALRAAEADGAPTIIMDADGEDRPQDVPRLLAALDDTSNAIVFAQRARRSEGAVFRTGYRIYRAVQRVLTGVSIDVGNFSAVPARLLPTLAATSELWNHYAAAVFGGRIPIARVPCDRGTRLEGRSRLSLTRLVLHGLGAMSVFADRIGVRVLVASLGLAALLGVGIAGVVAVRFGTDLAIPGWATTATGLLAILLFQALALALGFLFIVLNGRNVLRVVPARDHGLFVSATDTLHDAALASTASPDPASLDPILAFPASR